MSCSAIDREPFALALAQVKAKLDTARSDFDKLKSNLKSLNTLAELAEKNVDLKQRDVDRKTKLVSSQAGSQADLDTALAAVITAKLQAEFAVQQRDTTLNQLLGDPDLPLERFPEYAQAKAALDSAQRDFDHTIVRAPIVRHGDAGGQHPARPLRRGRHPGAERDRRPGAVGRRQSEGNRHHLSAYRTEGDDRCRHASRIAPSRAPSCAVSPGTGAQFSILPPQNATGNWVKVVQRVPVRIAFDKSEDTKLLRRHERQR